ncbi:MAG: hypothetical protein SVK54_04720 [candidate division WOR-3 bacterium]|nr:hypothetical protein [candidate division WOR-3 bacterium]
MNKRFIAFIIILLTVLTSCQNVTAVRKARKFIEDENYIRAENILKDIDNKTPEVYFLLGETYRSMRKFPVADSFYNIALKQQPALKGDIIKAYSSIAMTEFLKGFDYNANKYWNKVLNLDPDHDINIGFYYLGKHRYENDMEYSSKKLLLSALNISLPSEKKIDAYRMIINIYKNEEKFDTALIYVEQAIDEFGDMPASEANFTVDMGEILFNIAKRLYEEGEKQTALPKINKFIALGQPRSLLDDAYLLRGNIYFDIEEYEKAIPEYKKVQELNDVKLYGSRDTYIEANRKLKEIISRTGR